MPTQVEIDLNHKEQLNANEKKERDDKKVSDMAVEAAQIKEKIKIIVKSIREGLDSESSINVKSIVSNITMLGKLVNKQFESQGKKGTALLADDFLELGVEIQSQNKEDFPALNTNSFTINQFLEDIRLKHQDFSDVFGDLATGEGFKNEDLTQSELDSFKKGYYILCPLLCYKYDTSMDNETTNNEPKTTLQSIMELVVSVFKTMTSLLLKNSEPSMSSQDAEALIENKSYEELASPLYDSLYATFFLVADTQMISQVIQNLPEQGWWERLTGSQDPSRPFKELLESFEEFEISGDYFEELFMEEVKKQLVTSGLKDSKYSEILSVYTKVGNNRMICESIKKLLASHLDNPHSSDSQFKELLDKHNSMSISADAFVAQFVTLVKDNQTEMNKDQSYAPILASFEALNKEGADRVNADMSPKESEVRLNSDTKTSKFSGLFEIPEQHTAKIGEEKTASSTVNPMHQQEGEEKSKAFNEAPSMVDSLGTMGMFAKEKSVEPLPNKISKSREPLDRQPSKGGG